MFKKELIMKRLFVLIIIVFTTMQFTNGQSDDEKYGTIIGIVVDTETSNPLPGATIILKDHSKGGVADVDGKFKIEDVLPGNYDIHFSFIGYQTFIYKDYSINVGVNDMGKVFLEVGAIEGKDITVQNSWRESPLRPSIVLETESSEALEYSNEAYDLNSTDLDMTTKKDEHSGSKSRTNRSFSTPTIKAAAHNDNEEYPFYLDYLDKYRQNQNVYIQNLEDRLTFRFVDSTGEPIWNLPFKVTNKSGVVLWEGRTYSNGENVIFPHTFTSAKSRDGKAGRRRKDNNFDPEFIIVNNGKDEYPVDFSNNRLTTIQLPIENSRKSLSVDLLFILDATGSMDDEIRQLKDNLYSIYTRINNSFNNIPLRFGLVEYRDKKDEFVTKIHQFNDDINQFQLVLDNVKAKGGGDTPEDIQSALDDALHEIQWNENALKLSFLVADAPPHINYNQEFTYIDAAQEANKRGIKLYTIGASGLDHIGEYVFRQISALTYSEFIFLTYGEQGESDGSSGAGKVSHHTGSNFNSRALDDLVVDIIRKEVSYQLPDDIVVHDDIEPENQESYLRLRMDNLWAQINKQIVEVTDGATVGLIPIFETTKPELKNFASYLQNLSIDLIVESNQMALVERERLEEILSEHGLSMAGIIDDGTYGEIGKLTKADIVFLGSIDYAGIDRVVMVRGVRLEDSRIIAAARVRI